MTIAIVDIEGKTRLTTRSGAYWVAKGDLLGHDGTGWVKADASTASKIFAQYIALEPAIGEKELRVCRKATFLSTTAIYTANTPQYLSGTGGATTETRPATDNDVIQAVGRSIDTYRARIELRAPVEFEMFLSPDNLDTSSEPGLGVADAGWAGPQLTGTETIYFKGFIPYGVVGDIAEAVILADSVNASAGDIDVSIVAAHQGASNVEDTGTAITAGDWTQVDTDNIIVGVDISACFDSGLWLPGMVFCVYVDPDGITGAANIIGLRIRGWRLP